jgi:hypothetical protein
MPFREELREGNPFGSHWFLKKEKQREDSVLKAFSEKIRMHQANSGTL